ncbi:MAG: hypothetical protein ACK5IC_07740 [Moheibacter sp.]
MKKQLICFALLGVLLSGCASNESSTTKKSETKEAETQVSTSTEETTTSTSSTSNLLMDDPDFHGVSEGTGDQTAQIVDRVEYATDWSDASWADVTVGIDQVQVVQLEEYRDYNDATYQGIVFVHFTEKSEKQDVSVYPQQAEITLNTDESVTGSYMMPRWDGALDKGESKDGWAAFGVNKLGAVSDITELKISFMGTNQAATDPDEKTHTYETTIELK